MTFNLQEAQKRRERTQRLSPQRQERILQHVRENPDQEHTIFSLSWLNAKSLEESLRNFCNVHALLDNGKLRRKERLHPAWTLG